MSDENEAPEGEDGEEKVKKKGLSGKALILFIVLPILLIGGGVGGAFFAGVFDSEETTEEVVEEEVVEEVDKVVVFYDMPELLVNLSVSGNKTAFLKLGVSLELDDETVLPELEKLLPRVMDNFQVYLRELRPSDLQGSAGIYRLKEELLYRINSSVKPIQVKDVLFKEMLVQ
ncbi:flagellar basal body protein FliL [Sneathiella sp. P13V-1]|uniref:flagellar basal body-associated FliL family protein n=1 Tax=Sneathiella sp. P13V-1 TaxID=2697366 RepID=UPI00187B925A|nr:flagellar basal body-associated FliL family protein [Sneathiella sp. P13V-1]MBE7638307.1 flagellar basal body protein FliL [Sneathiella sp. P13V-1]